MLTIPCLAALPVAAVPFDTPWPVVLVAGAAAGLFLLLWSQAGRRPFLIGMILSLAVAAAAIVADRVVVTDQERVEALFPRLAAAAEAGDAATILAALDPAFDSLRAEVEQAVREFHPDEVRITRLEVTVNGPPEDRRARADLLARVRGNARGPNVAGPAAALLDLSVDLRKVGDRFLITDVTHHEGNPMDRP